MKKLLSGVLLAFTTGGVFASPVTIDTDNYAIGTNISNVDSNASIHAVNYKKSVGFTYNDIFVSDAPTMDMIGEQPFDSVAAGFGDHAFTSQTGGFYNAWHYDYAMRGAYEYPSGFSLNVLGIRFLEPVRYLELRALSSSDMGYILAYDSSGNLLTTASQSASLSERPGRYYLQDLQLSRNQADIAYVVFGGSSAASRLNQITYDVPAPAPLALLGVGLISGMLVRIRRKYVGLKEGQSKPLMAYCGR